jgi:hypothetical protein
MRSIHGQFGLSRPSRSHSHKETGMPSSEEDLKKALKAFRKRLKMQQLEEDSRLGHSPLTGSKTKIVSIQPPLGFGREVWEELADQGFLKRDGRGFFELVPGK